MRQAAAEALQDAGSPMPPELRLGAVSLNGQVEIDFTKRMNFPETTDFVTLNTAESNLFLNITMLSGNSQEIDDNLVSWTVSSVSKRLIRLELEFESPLEVSQGDNPDILVVQAELSQYKD